MSSIPWNSQPLDAWAEQHAQGQFVDLAGRRTHYLKRGSGPPVILLHGFFYDSFTWHNNIDALAAHFTVYALDLWGFGYSARARLTYGYPLFAEQLRLFMDALGIDRAALVGHSMGAGTAIYFTCQHRERVRGLILVDAAAMPNPLPFSSRILFAPPIGELLFGLPGNRLRRDALRGSWIYDPDFLTDAYVDNVLRFQKIKGTTRILLTVLRRQFFDSLPVEVQLLGGINVPKLLVWGEHDTAVPVARGREMQALLPGARLAVIPGVGHCPHDETAAAFNELALGFLTTERAG